MRSRVSVGTALVSALAMGCADGQPMAPFDTSFDDAAVLAMSVVDVPFTAQDVPVAILDPGVARVTPARIVIRGVKVRIRVDATDARLSGFGELVANAVLDATGSGPVDGTFVIEPDLGGRWSGNWHGQRAPVGPVWVGDIEWHLRGESGPVAGLHASGTESVTSFTVVPAAYLGQMAGSIRSH